LDPVVRARWREEKAVLPSEFYGSNGVDPNETAKCRVYAGLNAARRQIDRYWSRKIYDAPNAKARAEVLAEERRVTSFFATASKDKSYEALDAK
jgi:hypothetical protein